MTDKSGVFFSLLLVVSLASGSNVEETGDDFRGTVGPLNGPGGEVEGKEPTGIVQSVILSVS